MSLQAILSKWLKNLTVQLYILYGKPLLFTVRWLSGYVHSRSVFSFTHYHEFNRFQHGFSLLCFLIKRNVWILTFYGEVTNKTPWHSFNAHPFSNDVMLVVSSSVVSISESLYALCNSSLFSLTLKVGTVCMRITLSNLQDKLNWCIQLQL